MQRKNDTQLSPSEQLRQLLPLARMLVAEGLVPDITLAEFDATAKLMNHASGLEALSAEALREAIRISRPNPGGAQR
jgi:hypothetical protein